MLIKPSLIFSRDTSLSTSLETPSVTEEELDIDIGKEHPGHDASIQTHVFTLPDSKDSTVTSDKSTQTPSLRDVLSSDCSSGGCVVSSLDITCDHKRMLRVTEDNFETVSDQLEYDHTLHEGQCTYMYSKHEA